MSDATNQCSFCAGKVERPVANPRSVFICNKCLALARDIVRGSSEEDLDNRHPTRTCSFCGEDRRLLVAGPTIYICKECVYRFS
jgi:ATP-dependent protease Clp ATPase subunit